MRRKIPGTAALIAFEASARHGSFSRAALELSITEGAVSRQIARLEEQLGVMLFTRKGNRVELSRHGADYAQQVREILARLERESVRLVAQPQGGGTLEIAVIPTFASRWLIPRLVGFQQLHPEITVNLSERAESFALAGSGFDGAVHFDHPAWAGMRVLPLFSEVLVPVCRPELLSACQQGAGVTLLHKRATPDAWLDFAQATGAAIGNPAAGPRFDLFSMLIEGARAGIGVALVPKVYVAHELSAGRLVIPWAGDVGAKRFVWIRPETPLPGALVERFGQWLMSEAAVFRLPQAFK